MRKGDEVEFGITGTLGRFKGVVMNPNGHNGRPEIEVTQTFSRSLNGWVLAEAWPILKDGDYILAKRDKHATRTG